MIGKHFFLHIVPSMVCFKYNIILIVVLLNTENGTYSINVPKLPLRDAVLRYFEHDDCRDKKM